MRGGEPRGDDDVVGYQRIKEITGRATIKEGYGGWSLVVSGVVSCIESLHNAV
jgi:hypothetical protein